MSELTQSPTQVPVQPWYRQPMVLLVVAIPAVAVVVSFTMLAVSIVTFDGVVVDDYYRHGKEINQVLRRDDTAKRLGISAQVAFNGQTVDATVEGITTTDQPETLTLRILHPTRRNHDIIVDLLLKHNRQYTGQLQSVEPGEWIVQIETSDWRLSGRARVSDGLELTLGSDGLVENR